MTDEEFGEWVELMDSVDPNKFAKWQKSIQDFYKAQGIAPAPIESSDEYQDCQRLRELSKMLDDSRRAVAMEKAKKFVPAFQEFGIM